MTFPEGYVNRIFPYVVALLSSGHHAQKLSGIAGRDGVQCLAPDSSIGHMKCNTVPYISRKRTGLHGMPSHHSG